MPPKKSKAIWRHFYVEKSQRHLRSINDKFFLLKNTLRSWAIPSKKKPTLSCKLFIVL